MSLTPIYVGRAKNVRDTLSGQFVTSGPTKTADVLVGVGKRYMSDKELKNRKKLQAATSITTSTLGLTALGLKGGAWRYGKAASKATKLAETTGGATRNKALLDADLKRQRARKLDQYAINTSLTAGGVGGVGGYNFASYTAAEGKRRRGEPTIKKNLEIGMDFGLGGVTHSEISKRDEEVDKGFKEVGQAVQRGAQAARKAPGDVAWKLKHKRYVKSQGSLRQIGKSAEFGTKKENQKKIRRDATVAAVGGYGVVGSYMAGGTKNGRDAFAQAHAVNRTAVNVARANWATRKNPKGHPDMGRRRLNSLKAVKMTAGKNKSGLALMGSTAVLGTGYGMLARDAKRENQRIAASRRRKRVVIKNFTPIEKAYDPERKRQRRLDHYSQASAVGAGALGTGALIFGQKAKKGGVHKLPKNPVFGRGVRAAGASAALGVGAIGLAVGSDRIKQYKRGRGGSYKPMHTIGY